MKTTAFAAALAVALFSGSAVFAEATRPTDPSRVLATVQASGGMGGLRDLEAELAKDPTDLPRALVLARNAIELGRSTADPRYYGQAEAALSPWWTDDAAPAEVLVLRATIRQAFHQFDAALADLDAVIAANPDDAQARFSRASIHLTRGEPQAAAADCAGLTGRPLTLVQAICTARVEALSGRGPAAATALIGAIGAARQANPAMVRFALAVLADIRTGLGDWQAARRYYQQTIASGAAGVAETVAYADLLLRLGRPEEALAMLEDQGQSDAVVLRQAIAAKAAGDRRAADWQAILGERFDANRKAGNRVHRREEARFQLEVCGDPAAALVLAVENFKVQREPADAELLMQAAIAAGKPDAAAPVLSFLKATGLKDQRLEPLRARLSMQEQGT